MDQFEIVDPESYRLNEKFGSIVNQILVVLMLVCFGITVMRIMKAIDPSWRGEYLPFVVGLVSLESLYSFRLTLRWSNLKISAFTYYLIEIVVLMVVVKAILYVWYGPARFYVDLRMMQENFLGVFFDGEFALLILIGFIFWFTARMFGRDLLEIEGDIYLLKADMEGLRSDRGAYRSRLVSRTFIIGLIMVFLTGLVRLDLTSMGIDLSHAEGGVLNVIVYFILGMTMMALSHFAELRASWAWEKIPIAQGLTRRWLWSAFIFLLLTAFAAFMLPTRYTLGFLTTAGYLLSWLYTILYSLIMLILLPLLLLISFLMSFFSQSGEEGAAPEQVLPQIEPLISPPADLPWFEVLKAVLFWAVFIGVIGYAFYQYLDQNKELLARFRMIPFIRWLSGWLGGIFMDLEHARKQAAAELQKRIRDLRTRSFRSAGLKSFRYFSLRRLPPREKVLFFYLALVRRGNESGLPRRSWQTPNEYARDLEASLVELEEDVEGLTGSFLEARYSQHEITNERAGFARRCWESLRKALHPKRSV